MSEINFDGTPFRDQAGDPSVIRLCAIEGDISLVVFAGDSDLAADDVRSVWLSIPQAKKLKERLKQAIREAEATTA